MTGETFERLLSDCTVEQLRDLAREYGLKRFSRLDKEGLISLLLEKVAPVSLKDSLKDSLLSVENNLPRVNSNADDSADDFADDSASTEPMEKAIKERRFSSMGIWASILGIPIGVIALVVTFILSSSSDKQLNDVKTKLERFDPLKRDEVLKEKDTLLTESEKRIKELEKAVTGLCVGAPRERQEALAELAIAEEIYGKEHPNVAMRLNILGSQYDDLGNYRQAIFYYQQALAIDEAVFGKEHPKVAMRLHNLGAVYFQIEQKDKAKMYFEKAYVICKKVYGDDHPSTKTVERWLEDCSSSQ